jgi:hypothetical protein
LAAIRPLGPVRSRFICLYDRAAGQTQGRPCRASLFPSLRVPPLGLMNTCSDGNAERRVHRRHQPSAISTCSIPQSAMPLAASWGRRSPVRRQAGSRQQAGGAGAAAQSLRRFDLSARL